MKDDFAHYKPKLINTIGDNRYGTYNGLAEVRHTCWVSMKKIGFVVIINHETGQEEEYEVDETYKVTGQEVSVEWTWIPEVLECYNAGEIYWGEGPLEYQHLSADNYLDPCLPYVGLRLKHKSFVQVLKPLQYQYITIWYRIELAMARDKGKVPLIDITTIPKSSGMDIQKWMHYLSALGVAFINPYEEGWDVPGREGGRASTFSNFTAMDLTMGQTIGQYIGLLEKIEQTAQRITGITDQRLGSISAGELVGNVERSTRQSAYITEPWFYMHDQVKREVLTMLLNIAKTTWKDNRRSVHYVLDDATRTFVELSDDFFYEDMDIFVEDSTKNQQKIESLRSMVQAAMQNGASLLEAAEILTLDNLTMIKNKLKDIDDKKTQMEQQMQQQQAEQQQAAIEAEREIADQKAALEEAKMDLKKYEIDENNLTKITVAEITAYRGKADLDQNSNGIPDPIEIANQAMAERELSASIADRQLDARNKERELTLKAQAEKDKVDLEKQKMKHETDLQKQKDDAAYKREKLKADTALKNPVVGEKSKKK